MVQILTFVHYAWVEEGLQACQAIAHLPLAHSAFGAAKTWVSRAPQGSIMSYR